MWLVKWFLNLFNEQEENKGSNVGAFSIKLNNKKPPYEKSKHTWTGPYRKR
jgi:hypothetical protein